MSELMSIVINNNTLRVALLNRTRKGTRVRRLLEKECPREMVDDSTVREPEAFAGFLKLQLGSAGIRAREAVFTLPADKLMTREVVLPEVSDARIRQIIDTNAGEYFPINLEDYVVGFYRIAAVRKPEEQQPDGPGEEEGRESGDVSEESGKKKRGPFGRRRRERKPRRKIREERGKGKKEEKAPREIRVMVIAAPNEMVRALYETADYLKIRSVSIDFIGNSVFRLAQLQVSKEPTLTVEISGGHTALTFFDSGDMIMQRNVDFGLDQIVDIVAREKWVSPDRADEMLRMQPIIHEDLSPTDSIGEPLLFAIDMIRRTMMYYTRNRGMRPVEQVLLMGDAVYYRGARELLEAQLSVPVTSVEQLRGVSIPRTPAMHDQAMRFLDNYGAVIAPVGFVSQELLQARRANSGRKLYRAILAAAALGSAALIAVPAVRYFTLRREVEELDKGVAAMSDADAVLASYEEARLRGEDVRQVTGLTASHNDEFQGFVDALEQVRPRDLEVRSLTADEGEITLSVVASGKELVAAMLRALETMDHVSEVEAGALTSYYTNGQEVVSCSITCRLTNKTRRDYEEAGALRGAEGQ